jgi:hypothetical protein
VKYFFIIFLFPFLLHAQSEYMDSSYFGLGAGYSYSGSEKFDGNEGSLGLSILGMFDLGFQWGKSRISESAVSASANSFYLAYNAKIKNNKNCFKILIGYINETITPGQYNDIKASGLVLGFNFLIKISQTENFTLMPELGLSYGFLSVDNNNPYSYNDNSEFDDTRNISLSLNYKADLSKTVHIIFDPTISKDLLNSDNPLMLGIGVGLLINTAH